MVTQNVINGFVIPDDIAEIRDFPREFKISTVDFVYQRIAFLIECFPLRKEIIELAQSDNDCQKMKRKILKGENDLTIILAGNDGLTDTALDILSYLVIKADKTNPTLYQIVKKIDGESDKLFEKMFHENDLSKRTITRGFKAALDIFQAASVKDGDSIRKIVKDFDNSFSDSGTEAMMAFVKEAVSDIWDVATLGDMIYALRYDSDCNSWDMPEMADFFTQAVKNGVAPAPPLNMSSRPRIDMCMSSFRISTSIGVNHHSLYKFPITEKMKERICAIMAMSCTVDPRKMVHRASIDRGIRDAYIALVWQYVVSSFGEKQQKNAILEKSTTIYNQRKLRKRELENKKYEEQLKQKASEVKKEVAKASTNAKLEKVKKELYDFKATSMKRETALRKKNDDAESRIHELEKLLANAERKLIQLRPETSEFDDFDDSDAGICEQETEVIDYHKELNQMAKNKKIVFCGGQQNFVNMLRNAQPDISYVDQCNLATCDALIANSDIVIFRVTQMSHSLYGKAKQICKARGIRFEHLPNVTSIPLTEELIYTLITKKEATSNE
ncbi:hypothetical protein [Phocaeicola plebeius]|uniref:hypothetical protein n=1 Tax=Phocaeicola plebeius TaxID=310297 RepID=UPI0026EE496D|nr:hypothetical protein [Phocaeicola plebeius]